MFTVFHNFQFQHLIWHCKYGTFMFLLVFLDQMLEMSTPDLAAEISSFPGVPGHAPDLLLAQVHSEVINNSLQLIKCCGLTPHHMGQSLSPQSRGDKSGEYGGQW